MDETMGMKSSEITTLFKNTPPDIEAECVPGMRLGGDWESERVFHVRRHRRLEPILLLGEWYLLPIDSTFRVLVQNANTNASTNVNSSDKRLALAAVHDYLMERNIPIPPRLLAVMGLGARTDKQSMVRQL